ncbi:MAG: carboxypeptidase regulatory-like domain-containing protein, partial [Oscillospiraceae bacterium]|nr:carboxypeptidase regulatory-like domain-containing protein [Oscillospiraceae bacterium]
MTTYNTDQPEQGRLQISVYAGGIGTPATGAVIRVTPKDDDTHIIDEVITDDSGQSSELFLPAPPLEYSMEP